ncbi:MAG TPA: TlyA family RNA methyltransferase [Blastocatellia bacterium]|nr:TlyA family RNA methyltransferase [Blastocatellia bacterium]
MTRRVTKQRIDKTLVDRGLAETRARAQAMILAGQVLVREQRIDKPGQMIDADADIRIKGETLRYVSRGGLKLEAALRDFRIDPTGKTCLDIGASTGGFTDCLLQHGAACVWAVDVGHGQLAWRIRQDPRVIVMEGVNVRGMSPDRFPARFDIVTVDVSFISLAKVFPSVVSLMTNETDCIALVKPQFEVGKGEVGRGGIVTDTLKHRRVLAEVVDAARESGLEAVGLIESPILGVEGNREFLVHLRRSAGAITHSEFIDRRIQSLTCGGELSNALGTPEGLGCDRPNEPPRPQGREGRREDYSRPRGVALAFLAPWRLALPCNTKVEAIRV